MGLVRLSVARGTGASYELQVGRVFCGADAKVPLGLDAACARFYFV